MATAAPYIKVAIAIGSVAASIALAAGQPPTQGPRLGDLSVSAATYGLPIPHGWGVVRLGGNMIWTTGIKESTHREGGKGMGGSKSGTQVYTYSASFAFAFAAGPAARILRIWADSKIVYDETSSGPLEVKGVLIRRYFGTEDQMPDAAIIADKGAENVPAFRGLVYLVAEDVPLDVFGNRIPNISAEVAFQGSGATGVVNLTNPIPDEDNPFVPNTLTGGDYSTQFDQVALDYARNQVYRGVGGNFNPTPGAGLEVSNLLTMQVTRFVTLASMYEDTAFGFPMGEMPDGYSINMIVCGNGSDLYLSVGTLFDQVFLRVNPESMKITGSYGPGTALFTLTADGIWNPLSNAYNYTVGGPGLLGGSGAKRSIVAYCSQGNGPELFDGLLMIYLWGASLYTRSGPAISDPLEPRIGGNNRCIAGAHNTDGSCEFWYFDWGVGGDHSGVLAGPQLDMWNIKVQPAAAFVADMGLTIGVSFDLRRTYGIDNIYGPSSGHTSIYLQQVEFDRANNCVIMFVGDNFNTVATIVSVNSSGDVMWRNTDMHSSHFDAWPGFMLLEGSTMGVMDGFDAVLVNTSSGATMQRFPADGHMGLDEGVTSYNSLTGIIYHDSSPFGFQAVLVNRGQGATAELSDIVRDLCIEAGLKTTDIDTSDLTDDVRGYSHVQETTRNLISDLAGCYFFDGFESEDKLKFIHRGKAPVFNVPYADVLPQGTQNASLPVQRNQAETIPRRVWVRYPDTDHDQQQGTQHFARSEAPASVSVINSAGENTLDLRLVLNADEAKTIAKKRLLMMWQERESFPQLGLPPSYIALDPADVITLNSRDGTAFRVRVTQVSIGADLSLQAEGTIEDANLLTITAQGDGGVVMPNLIPAPFTPLSIQPEMPLLRDQDDTLGLSLREYGAIGCYAGQSYIAATIFISPDNVSWGNLMTSSTGMKWGNAINKLPPPPVLFATDHANRLDVVMAQGGTSLESATTDQILTSEANGAALITTDGKVELLQYTTVEPLGSSVYRLSGLIRGRRGSEWVCDKHAAGDFFVLLDTVSWRTNTVPLAWLNSPKWERTVGIQESFDAIPSVPHTFAGTSEKPYAPVFITSSRDGSNNLIITWQRRTRIGGDWNDIPNENIPLGEHSEAYDVDILAGDGSVLRTLHSTSPTATYLFTDQTTDGLSASPVPVVVYQVSEAVGRGYGANALLPDIGGSTGTGITITGITLG